MHPVREHRSSPRVSAPRLALILLGCIPPAATAQCLSWDVSRSLASSAPGDVRASIVTDIGAGMELLIGTSSSGVMRWNGTEWVALGTGSPTLTQTFATFDDGSGTALYAGGSSMMRWTGSSWVLVGGGMFGTVYALVVHDDGAGPRLWAGGGFTEAGGQPALSYARWNGVAWSALPSTPTFSPIVLHSVSSGPLAGLYAGGGSTSDGPMSRLAKWNGTSWVALGDGAASAFLWVNCLAMFDRGSGPELYAGGTDGLVTFPLTWPALMRWNGVGWSTLTPDLGQLDSFGGLTALQVIDDGAGRALYAGGSLAAFSAPSSPRLARYDGATWTGAAGGLGGTSASIVFSLTAFDDGTGAGPGLAVGGSFLSAGGAPTRNFAVLHGCRIRPFCAGDGLDPRVTTACPCANFGAAGRGCAWSGGASGALLAASGVIDPADELVLTASGMPATTSAVFFKGSALATGGVVFGDGVRCAGGTLVRLGAKVASAGAASFPAAGDPSISVAGGNVEGSGITTSYQTAYRNAVTFCSSATSNATNGIQVVW